MGELALLLCLKLKLGKCYSQVLTLPPTAYQIPQLPRGDVINNMCLRDKKCYILYTLYFRTESSTRTRSWKKMEKIQKIIHKIMHHYLALATWYSISDTWYLILNIWYLIYDTWYLILDIWYLISDSWYLILDIWYLVSDTWNLVLDIWYSITAAWYLILYIWFLISDTWYLIFASWY